MRCTPHCRRRALLYGAMLVTAVLYALSHLLEDDKTRRDVNTPLFASTRDRVKVKVAQDMRVTPGKLVALDGIWQNVSGAEHKLLVFTAFYERRDALPRGVRVVEVTRTEGSAPVWCRLWYDDAPRKAKSVVARVQIIRENWDRECSACFFLCPLSEDAAVPDSVSIVRRLRDLPANRLRVVDNYDRTVEGPGKLAVCVQPLHSLHDPFRMIEFVELYSLLGVEHFTFYDNNTDASLCCLLDAYVLQGRVTLLPWNLPMDGRVWDPKLDVKGPEIWVHGIHAALNDCLYRNMYRYANVAMVDLDELES